MNAFFKEKAERGAAGMEQICSTSGLTVGEVVERVHRDGIVVFPGLIADATLASLKQEFETILGAPDQYGHKVDRGPGLLNARCRMPALQEHELLRTYEFFKQPIFAEIAEAYFDTSEVVTNGEIFVNRNTHTETPMNKPPFLLHFDKREVFKFFIYLSDTSAEDGAMRVAPRTVQRNRNLRLSQMEAGVDLDAVDNVIDEDEFPAVSVDGPAGTLFVFTTDVAHGAGQVRPGRSRSIMRGHCHSHEMLRAMGQRPSG